MNLLYGIKLAIGLDMQKLNEKKQKFLDEGLLSSSYSFIHDFNKIFHSVNDEGGTCIFKFIPGSVPPCHTTSLGSCICSHLDVNCHIADYKCFPCIKMHVSKGLQHRLRLWLGLFYIVSTKYIRDIVCNAHISRQLHERVA